MMLALAVKEEFEIIQFDVKTAFLYGILQEDVYMTVPEGVSVSDSENSVCKLEKALYGLKQASRCWNDTFKSFLSDLNFVSSNAERSIFCGMIENERVYILLFVDDGLIMTKNVNILNYVVSILKEKFEVTVCEPDTFVGIKIERDRVNGRMFLHQSDYAKKILARFNMEDAKPISTPLEKGMNLNLMEEHYPRDENFPYRELIGSLMYLSVVSRPDITYAVNVMSKFLDKYNASHCNVAKRILRYVKGTIDCGILYTRDDKIFEPEGFCDSDFAGDTQTRKSTSGYIFKMCQGPISWCAQKQSVVALSSTEAEYIAAATACREAVWLRQLLSDIGHPCARPTVLQMDNQSAMQIVKNPVYHKRTKHIDVQFHFVREKYESGVIDVKYVPTNVQLADILTKALSCDRHQMLSEMIGVYCVKSEYEQTK